MKTYTITKADLDKDNFYIGREDLTDFNGQIESEKNLNTIKFKTTLKAKFGIYLSAGCGISAGGGISAGYGISAGDGISAGGGISAGYGISAGRGISAGDGISAGGGISAKTISSKLRIFAGICRWKIPTGIDIQIRVEKVIEGQICYGELVLIQPKQEKIETIKVGALTFNKNEVENALANLKPIS